MSFPRLACGFTLSRGEVTRSTHFRSQPRTHSTDVLPPGALTMNSKSGVEVCARPATHPNNNAAPTKISMCSERLTCVTSRGIAVNNRQSGQTKGRDSSRPGFVAPIFALYFLLWLAITLSLILS